MKFNESSKFRYVFVSSLQWYDSWCIYRQSVISYKSIFPILKQPLFVASIQRMILFLVAVSNNPNHLPQARKVGCFLASILVYRSDRCMHPVFTSLMSACIHTFCLDNYRYLFKKQTLHRLQS